MLRKFLIPIIKAYLLLGALVRIGLWAYFRADSNISFGGLLTALGVGIVNDSIEFLYLSLPISMLLLILPRRWLGRSGQKVALGFVSYIALFIALFTALAEVLFWEEFESRFNLIAVDYLIYPHEVIGNIGESYPVVPLLAGAVVVCFGLWIPVWRSIRQRLDGLEMPRFRARLGASLRHVAVVIPCALLCNAESFSFSNNRAVNELSKNGAATFFRAFLSQELDYNHFYRTLPREQAYALLRRNYESMGERYASTDPYSLMRVHEMDPRGLGKMNVVILTEESLGAQYVGAYGDTRGLTPVLDRLAQESMLFSNAYATGTRTVRGLEAIAASFPPIPSESIVKRPHSDHISTWGNIMRQNGYHTSFIYGGYGAFDNMNAFFGGNDFNLTDRLDVKNPKFGNIWGVSDEDLHRHAVSYFDALHESGKGPFFSVVLSTSNHKPFTFPPNPVGIPEAHGGREAGIRYADYSIGKFFEAAKTRPWFDNTLFVVIADHDSRVYGRAYVPVEHYRIPAMIYAPKRIQPQVVSKVFSSMDLAPTVLGLLGIGYEAPFYGVDVLRESVPASRPVMFSHNHNIALYEANELTVLGLQKEAQSFHYDSEKTTDEPLNVAAADLLTAYLQTAYEKFQAHAY